jgi:hypothetical protein
MRVKKVTVLPDRHLQCDITTATENFYIIGNEAAYLVHNSPACYFGRLPDGQFVLTDKSGFTAKGYNGLVTSAKGLEQMFLNRGKEVNDARATFAKQMASLWDRFEKVVPEDFRGFVKGDLLYRVQPPIDDKGDYVFTPNVVTYHVDSKSSVGQRIAMSTAAIAVHTKSTGPGEPEVSVDINELNLDTEVMIVGPTYVEHTPKIDKKKIAQARKIVSTYASAIDSFLNTSALNELKITDAADIFYTFMNAMVKTGKLSDLVNNFLKWLPTSKVSGAKQERLLQYITENKKGFVAIFTIVEVIITVKNDIIDQLDSANTPIRASINGQRGGEGYVQSHEKGAIKYVNRAGFSAANFAKER